MKHLKTARRIVIKIGSALVTDAKGNIRRSWLQSLAEDIAWLKEQKKEVVVVSSGAVALGKKRFKNLKKVLKLEEKQAAAACGQSELVETYRKCLKKHDLEAAQILLSVDDTENRRRYLNVRNTVETLLGAGIVPVINENDSVATEEIRFGDNDRLAARVAQMIEADMLILLSDIDGLYSADPNIDKAAKHIAEVKKIDARIEKMAGNALSNTGTGGMVTKINAASIATRAGCHTVITLGTVKNPLKALGEGVLHTIFLANKTPHSARKQWIAHSLDIKGSIELDKGAYEALKKGKSLLPAGVTGIKGKFRRGDAVAVTFKGKEIARGLIAYSSDDTKRIIGHNSKEIEKILGFAGRDALIHRDDMVLE